MTKKLLCTLTICLLTAPASAAERLPVGVRDGTETTAVSDDQIVVHPEREDTMLLNPGKGWVQYYGSDKYTKDYIGIGYTRWAWSVLEPKEGQYNWKEIDGFSNQFKRHGKKNALGVMTDPANPTPKPIAAGGPTAVALA